MPDVSLQHQIAEVKRELALRANVYPKMVASGRLKQVDADRNVERMTAVLRTLEALAAGDYAKMAELHGKHHSQMIDAETGHGK